MRGILSCLTLVALLAAGCLTAPAEPEPTSSAATSTEPASCTPADTNTYGTTVNQYHLAQGEVWEETNGIASLQKTETCEGPADTRIA